MAGIGIADQHLLPHDDLTQLIQFVHAKEDQGYKIYFLGDLYEGFLEQPWYIPALRNCYFCPGNHEYFWKGHLANMYGQERVQDYFWVNRIYLSHGNEFDRLQDSAVEIALAQAALEIYVQYPDDPALEWLYGQILNVHRTNAPIIKGLTRNCYEAGCTGHSHVQCAMVEQGGGLRYFNPGSWRDKPAYVQIEDSGEMHLEVL